MVQCCTKKLKNKAILGKYLKQKVQPFNSNRFKYAFRQYKSLYKLSKNLNRYFCYYKSFKTLYSVMNNGS